MSVDSLEKWGLNPQDLAAIYVERDGGVPRLGRLIVREGESAPKARGRYGAGMGRHLQTDAAEVFYRHENEKGEILDDLWHAGPQSLRARFIDLGGNEEEFDRSYIALFRDN